MHICACSPRTLHVVPVRAAIWIYASLLITRQQVAQHWTKRPPGCDENVAVQLRGLRLEAEGTSWLEIHQPGSDVCAAYVLGDMITDAAGKHSHTLMELRTPGVMHTMVFSHAARKVRSMSMRTEWQAWHRYLQP